MKVFIHLENLFTSYRMQQDGTFLRYEGDSESDFNLLNEAEDEERELLNTIHLDKITYKIESAGISLLVVNKTLMKAYRVRIESRDPVHVPDYDQLKACIRSGNDHINNQLELTVFGDFILENNFLSLPEYYKAVRFEICTAGNRDIGKEAAENEEYIQNQYAFGLEGYKDFLRTHEVNKGVDYNTSPEQIEKKQASYYPDIS